MTVSVSHVGVCLNERFLFWFVSNLYKHHQPVKGRYDKSERNDV